MSGAPGDYHHSAYLAEGTGGPREELALRLLEATAHADRIEIARLLFVAHKVRDRDQLRRDLLAYCERDTWAMVRLLDRLRQAAM